MRFPRVLGGLATLLLGAACSGQTTSGGQGAAEPAPRPLAPLPPTRVPELPETGERDADGSRLDDVFDERLTRASSEPALLAEVVELEVILTAPVEQAELDDSSATAARCATCSARSARAA